MGKYDIALRHITRRHPEDLARALLPPGLAFEVVGWLDTQVTALERRLDRALDLRVAGERRALHVEAVYQRTVAELRSRGTLLWRVFTPLATDASAASMREVLTEIRERVPQAEERADLLAALLVMAEIDPWGHNLREEIEAMLQAEEWELYTTSPTLRKAFDKGAEEERRQILCETFSEQAGREPTPEEQEALARRANELGRKEAIRALLKLHGDALVAWLLGNDSSPERAG